MQKLTIVKVGGKVVENPNSLDTFLNSFTQIEGHKALAHGGGKVATEIAAKLGVETKMVEGRRITNKQTLDVVTMVYGGLVNKNIVAWLQALGCNALGLTGADLNVIQSVKRPAKDIDYGYVGDIEKVDVNILQGLVNQQVVPVIAPLTHDKQGNLLNTNADTIAATLAQTLSKHYEVQLIYCFEKNGVLLNENDDTSVIKKLTYSKYQEYKEKEIINRGMIPKLDNAFATLQTGVKMIKITHYNHLDKTEMGTSLV